MECISYVMEDWIQLLSSLDILINIISDLITQMNSASLNTLHVPLVFASRACLVSLFSDLLPHPNLFSPVSSQPCQSYLSHCLHQFSLLAASRVLRLFSFHCLCVLVSFVLCPPACVLKIRLSGH